MPRGKRAEKPVQVQAIEPGENQSISIEPNFSDSDEQLVKRFIDLDDWVKAEKKRFANFMEGHTQKLEVIRNEFHRRLIERKSDSTKTEYGTAYKTTLFNLAVTPEETAPYTREIDGVVTESRGREALLDFALDHWDEIGNELLMIDAQKDAVKRWMEEHNGLPPPGIKMTPFIKVNIRRS